MLRHDAWLMVKISFTASQYSSSAHEKLKEDIHSALDIYKYVCKFPAKFFSH
jgi:hypothetical protein